MYINTGRLLQNELNEDIAKASYISDAGERIAYLSGLFLDTPYQEATLSGSADTAEELVIDLEGLDCFTYIDYVEAMRRSGSFPEFIENLKNVRYREGEVSFMMRNHFFTDWAELNTDLVTDVSKEVGGRMVEKITKLLNRRDDGTFLLDGVEPGWRDIMYIPAGNIDEHLLLELMTGDYIGIYSNAAGLDVSHVGIIINEADKVFLRHASTIHKRVVDEDFSSYIKDKLGIIVLRPIGISYGSK